ncbi:MAG: RadC family protein, partial [Desulfobacterales bacterium]
MKQQQSHKGNGHRRRLREKFLESGLSGFHDYEVVELLLTLATPRKDCKQPAKEAVKRFGSLPGVLEAPEKELCEIKGIGPKNVFGIKLVPAVAKRYLEKKVVRTDPISNAGALFDYLYHSMADKGRECFKVLFLDAKNRVLGMETLFEGTLTAGAVYPR